MSTCESIIDIDADIDMEDLKTLIKGHNDNWEDYSRVVMKIGNREEDNYSIGCDDDWNPFRLLFDQCVPHGPFLLCKDRIMHLKISFLLRYKISYDYYQTWESMDFNDREIDTVRDDLLACIEWIEKHLNHWAMAWS